ncbi:MAG TPA: hypothetical protein VMF13_15925 [Luteitalea sp.]|nr:hypothetical protein [Luteitalea sp.]
MCRTLMAAAAAVLVSVPAIGAAQSVNMGSTFHALEARARRLSTTYTDAVVEVRRGTNGDLDVVVREGSGERGRLRVAGGARRVEWQATGAAPHEFALPDQAAVGLDWAAQQAYALHADGRRSASEGRALALAGDDATWDGLVRRDRRALRSNGSSGQLSARIQAVETVFDEVVVRAALDPHTRRSSAKRTDYSRFTATIHDARTGAKRGFVRWFDTAQVLTWKIEGGSQGVILPERLRGGWTFTPTMAWANVQGYQFVTQAARTLEEPLPFAGMVTPARLQPFALLARAVAPAPAAALSLAGGWAGAAVSDSWARIGTWSLPAFGGGTAAANEPGCDNLHWLDGSIFRACCDVHDRCYEKEGCSSGSWFWPFSGSWSCQRCNVAVVYCFCTVSNPAYCGGGNGGGSGGGDGNGGSCTSVAGGFCPIECQTCQSR